MTSNQKEIQAKRRQTTDEVFILNKQTDKISIPNQTKRNNVVNVTNELTNSESSNDSRSSEISITLKYCAFGLFSCIAITIAIIVVYFTLRKKSSSICQLKYIPMIPNSKYMNSYPRSISVGDFNNDSHLDIVVANSNVDNIGIFSGYGNGTFANQITYSTGKNSNPYSVVTGDLNNDYKLDLIVANYGTHNIGIFLGQGDNTFTNQTTYSTFISRPLQINLGDFNNDNYLDIVVLNYGTNSISLFLGYGNGSFAFPTMFSTGYDSVPSYIIIADLNNDNRLDIIIANNGTDNFGIFFGYNNGTFALQKIYSTGSSSRPSSIAVGDINNDNILDIAVTKYVSKQIGIFFGYDNGTFVEQNTFTTSIANPFRILIGDLNKDNKQDMIILYDSSNYISVWLGHGNGLFSDEKQYFTSLSSNPYFVTSGDFNNDERLDIAIVNMIGNDVGIFLGDNPVSFRIEEPYSTDYDAFPQSIAVKDINHDNHTDVVVANTWNDNICIFLGIGDGTLTNRTTYSTDTFSRPQSIVIDDFNNDNDMDIIVVNQGNRNIGIFFGYGNGSFTEQITYFSDHYYEISSIAIGDFNNDKCLDITISQSVSDNNVLVYLGYGNGSFENEPSYSDSLGISIQPVTVDDINNDGKLDIIALETYASTLFILFGYGNGSFGNQFTYASNSGSGTCSISINDLNNDNLLDIVIGYCTSSNIGILFGDNEKIFTNEILYSFNGGFTPLSIVTGDFNNDTYIDIIVAGDYNYSIYALVGHGNKNLSNPVIVYSRSNDSLSVIAKNDFNEDNRLDIIVLNQQSSTINIFLGYDFGILKNQTTYSTGSASNPVSVTVGNFNHDNQPDIGLANFGIDSVGVCLGSGNISFTSEIIYPDGIDAQPKSVVVGDFNRDTYLDIAVANSGKDNLGIFLGYGNGTFADERIYSTDSESHPLSVAVGDFNNDNWSDIVIANYGTNTIGVFFGYNYTRLVYSNTYQTGYNSAPNSITMADLNNDNQLDMIVINYRGSNFCIFLGDKDGYFVLQNTYETGSYSSPTAAAVGDFNKDNNLDLALVTGYGDCVNIYMGYGNGSLALFTAYSTGNQSNPQFIVVSDFNNDNRLDIVIANKGTNNIVVFLGQGDGNFGGMITFYTGPASYPHPMVVRDFNNDGRMDIIVGDCTNSIIILLLGYGNGSFIDHWRHFSESGASIVSLDVGDFNKDNCYDIVVVNSFNDNIYTLLGYNNGSFSDPIISTSDNNLNPTWVTVGDFNNDDLLDICISDTSGIIIIYHGIGDGTFGHKITYTIGYNTYPYYVVNGYFNYDNKLDIAVGNFDSNTVVVFFGDGCDPFSNQITFSTGNNSHPISVTNGDLNNDNHLDILVTNEGTNNIGIFINDGNGSFSNEIIFLDDFQLNPFSVSVVDLNNDHNQDIIIVNRDNESISIFFGYGNTSFQYDTSYSIGYASRPNSIAIGDFNNDTHLDIAVSNDGTNTIVIFSGYGNGSFTILITFLTGYNTLPSSLSIGDFNGDAIEDVVVTMTGTNNIGIVSKIC